MDKIKTILNEYNIDCPNYIFEFANQDLKCNNTINYTKVCNAMMLATNDNIHAITSPFEKRGIMLDLSRAKVFTVNTIKTIIVKSACFGYNYMTLYIEDLLEIPSYSQYGYLRGQLLDSEVRELVDFAKSLDYELIPAIQTLAHLEHFLNWEASSAIRGTNNVLRVKAPRTYHFLSQLIAKVQMLFNCEIINIGMDEAFELGFERIKFEKLDQKQLFLNHLEKVVAICHENNFKTIKMWSDMLFTIHANSSEDELYSTNFLQDTNKLNVDIELIYWNYWTKDSEQYSRILKAHQQFTSKLSMALAIHTSMNIFYDYKQIEASKCALSALEANAIQDVLYTMWSEDGGIYDINSIFFGMYESMRLMFKCPISKQSYARVTNSDYNLMRQICTLKSEKFNPMSCLWNDPLTDIYYRSLANEDLIASYAQIAATSQITNEELPIYCYYNHFLEYLKLDIERYLCGLDNAGYKRLIENYQYITNHIEQMWLEEAKLHGIEEIQSRFALKKYRYQFAKTHSIEEQRELKGHIKSRFIQLYGPNRWRF